MLTAKEFWLSWPPLAKRVWSAEALAIKFAEAYAAYCDHQHKMENYGIKSIFGEKVVGQSEK